MKFEERELPPTLRDFRATLTPEQAARLDQASEKRLTGRRSRGGSTIADPATHAQARLRSLQAQYDRQVLEAEKNKLFLIGGLGAAGVLAGIWLWKKDKR